VLNVGFGMGMVDEAIEKYDGVVEHTIVEAHPDVYERMMKCGWGEKKNVRIVFGRWQDVLPQLESYDGKALKLLIFCLYLCLMEILLMLDA